MNQEDRRDAIRAGGDELYQKIRNTGSVRIAVDSFRGCGGFDEVVIHALDSMYNEQSELQEKIEDIKDRVSELRTMDPGYYKKLAMIKYDLWELVE